MLPTFKSLSVRPWWTHMHQHLMICQPPLAWTNFTCERLSSSRHHQDLMWCDKDKHNTAVSLSLIVYCCSVLLISSLAGIGLRSGTCVPSKTNTGWFDLLDDFQSSCCSEGSWEGRRRGDWWLKPRLLLFLCFNFLTLDNWALHTSDHKTCR